MISEHIPDDSLLELKKWKKLNSKNIELQFSSLDSTDAMYEKFKQNFNLTFVLFNLLNIEQINSTDKYTVISRNYLIENIIQSLIATDNNLFTLASMEYRSAIESALRFALAIEHVLLEDKKPELWKKKSNDRKIINISKKIKSNLDTHKIGKFTNFSKHYFEESPLSTSVDEVLEIYTMLSNKVHTNDFANTYFVKYLRDIYNLDTKTVSLQTDIFNRILTHIFIICYLSIKKITKAKLIGIQTKYFLKANSNIANLFELLELDNNT